MALAFVVIDLQERFRARMRCPALADVVDLVAEVAQAFRDRGHPVIFVQDDERGGPGTDGFEVLAELPVGADDRRVHKTAPNAFRTLSLPGVDFALLAGFSASGCVLASALGAADRDLPHAVLRGGLLAPERGLLEAAERILPIASPEVVEALLVATSRRPST